MNDNLESMWKEAVVASLKVYPGKCLERLMKTTKNLSQNNRSPDRDLSPVSLDYEAGILATQPRCLVDSFSLQCTLIKIID
jgi:hypothetical protein